MDHIGIVKQAFGMVRNHRVLWLLGLVTLLGGLIGSIPSIFQLRLQSSLMDPLASPEQIASQMGSWLLILCLWFLLYIVVTIISLAAQGGLIHAVDRIDDGQVVSFGNAFRAGWGKVWRLVGTLILLYAPLFLFYFVGIFGIAFAIEESGLLIACLFGMFCVFLILVVLIVFTYPFAMRGIVLREMGIREAIGHGWRVLRDNLGSILILALIFFLIYLLIYGILAVISLPLWLSAFFAQMGAVSSGGPMPDFSRFYGTIVIIGIVGSIINVFLVPWQSATFTLAYRQFTEKKPPEMVIEPTI